MLIFTLPYFLTYMICRYIARLTYYTLPQLFCCDTRLENFADTSGLKFFMIYPLNWKKKKKCVCCVGYFSAFIQGGFMIVVVWIHNTGPH